MPRTTALRDVCDVSHRRDWPSLLEQAATIVNSYDTLVTLRQLFYRLVAAALLENSQNAYKALSKQTAKARRAGLFPVLMDRGRLIHEDATFADPADARVWLAEIYRRDRTEGQAWSIYLAVEKAGIVAQLRAWFGHLGIPVLALGGYSSESYERVIKRHVAHLQRPTALLIAGDFDPSGEDIDRNFIKQTACWDQVHRIALTASQVVHYALPENPGKQADSRAAAFTKRHGRLVQVELDALPPDVLRQLYTDAIAPLWDEDAYAASLVREVADRRTLKRSDDEDDEQDDR